jgi:hypothetical protein
MTRRTFPQALCLGFVMAGIVAAIVTGFKGLLSWY